MFTDSRKVDGVLIVRVTENRLDASRAPAFKSELSSLIDDFDGKIVIDLSSVDFIDSSGLGVLVSAMKQVGSRGTIALACMSATVKKLFSLTRMDRVFSLHETVASAIEHVASNE